MTRQEKYPDTDTFHFYNANPKGRITGDCRIRAICTALEVPYKDIVMELAEIQCETGYDQCENHGISILMKRHGWIKHAQPRKPDNTKYTGKEFCRLHRSGRIYAHVGGRHSVAIVDGKIWDIWDSTDGCIGNYWTK